VGERLPGMQLLVDPYSPIDIARAMCRCLKDEKLYKMLVEKGLKRAKEFSWRNTAQQMLEVYRKISEV